MRDLFVRLMESVRGARRFHLDMLLPPTLAARALLAATLALPAGVQRFLGDGVLHNTPAGFRVVALSHVADGCAAHPGDPSDRHACVAQAFAHAWAHKPPGLDVDAGRAGLWLTHVALILGDADATGPCLNEELHRRIASSLARATARDPLAIARSFPSKSERWPADQAATLAALARTDRAHGTTHVVLALQRYRAQMERAHDDATNLPWSEAHGRGAGKSPRGCALSYAVRYLAEVDGDLATVWWHAYKTHFLVDRGLLVGFREWPPGSARGADVDPGPIVRGVGAAATAFGIAAARAMDDDTLALRLEATAAIVTQMAPHLTSTQAQPRRRSPRSRRPFAFRRRTKRLHIRDARRVGAWLLWPRTTRHAGRAAAVTDPRRAWRDGSVWRICASVAGGAQQVPSIARNARLPFVAVGPKVTDGLRTMRQ